jgi:predicted RNA-binding Zn ribbon-like protein
MGTRVGDVVEVDGLPEWELVFRFTSGRLCLSFCATVGERWRRSFERLRTPADLGRWLAQAGLAEAPVVVDDSRLEEARRLREAVYRLVRAAMADEPVADEDRAVVNEHARRQPVAAQIGPDGEPELWTGRDAVQAGLATVARDAVDLLTSGAVERVRECSAPDCALLFWDTSRPGRRRWCADGACGSRARSAAYRARRVAAAG